MNVDYELLQRGCLIGARKQVRLKQERIRGGHPARSARPSTRWWAQSDGRRSDPERHRRYRATEKGWREMVRRSRYGSRTAQGRPGIQGQEVRIRGCIPRKAEGTQA